MATKTTKEIVASTAGGEMKVSIADITPKKARELLSYNENNRALREKRINLYAAEMSSGNWKYNGVPIIIDENGELKDGQHRLKAVIKSNKTMKNTIIVQLPKDAANCYDIGAQRSVTDIAKLAGLGGKPFFRCAIICSAMKMAIEGKATGYGYSKLKIINEMLKHPEPCEFVYNNLFTLITKDKCKLRNSCLYAAVINAYLSGYDIDTLERFCQIMRNGVVKEDYEVPIIKLRDVLFVAKERSRKDRTKLYYQCQSALHSLITKQENVNIDKANKEYYPYLDMSIRESIKNESSN